MNLYNIGLLTGDNLLLDELKNSTDAQEAFIEQYRAELEGISQSGMWDKVMILCDGELAGLADASACAMLRMGGIPASHCNILDVRHGRHLTVDKRTLVIAVVSPLDEAYQSVLLRELRERGAQIMTISSRQDNIYGSDLNVPLPEYKNYVVRGLPLLYCLQAIAFFKTLADGNDPDTYGGGSRWVRL
jgi:fructoselysine-6-P-deglycase FrlB-like protein